MDLAKRQVHMFCCDTIRASLICVHDKCVWRRCSRCVGRITGVCPIQRVGAHGEGWRTGRSDHESSYPVLTLDGGAEPISAGIHAVGGHKRGANATGDAEAGRHVEEAGQS